MFGTFIFVFCFLLKQSVCIFLMTTLRTVQLKAAVFVSLILRHNLVSWYLPADPPRHSVSTHSVKTFPIRNIPLNLLPKHNAIPQNLSCQAPQWLISVWKHPPRTTLWYWVLSVNISPVSDSCETPSLCWQLNRHHCFAARGTCYCSMIFIIKPSVFILAKNIDWIQSMKIEPFKITVLYWRQMIHGGINRYSDFDHLFKAHLYLSGTQSNNHVFSF